MIVSFVVCFSDCSLGWSEEASVRVVVFTSGDSLPASSCVLHGACQRVRYEKVVIRPPSLRKACAAAGNSGLFRAPFAAVAARVRTRPRVVTFTRLQCAQRARDAVRRRFHGVRVLGVSRNVFEPTTEQLGIAVMDPVAVACNVNDGKPHLTAYVVEQLLSKALDGGQGRFGCINPFGANFDTGRFLADWSR